MITESNRFTQKWLINIKVEKLVKLCKDNGIPLENHCIRRIAYDNAVGSKWDKVVPAPFVKNATDEQMNAVNDRLQVYINDLLVITIDNVLSLNYRK